MEGSRSIPIRNMVRRVIIGGICAVVLTAFAAHDYLRRAAWVQSERARAADTARLIAHQLGARPDLSTPALLHFVRHLVELPNVLAVCVRDDEQREIASAARMPQLRDQLANSDPGDAILGTVMALPFDEALANRYEPTLGVWVPIANRVSSHRPLRLGLAIRGYTPGAPGAIDWYGFYIPVAGLALLALLLARQYLSSRLHEPLSAIVRSASGEANLASLPAGQSGSELSLLQEAFTRLRSELVTWRQRTHLIERRVDTEIARETKRINRDLRRVQKQAWMDALTGIYNRRFLQEKFPEIFTAQKNGGRDMSVVMLDLDHFKRLNDSLGHAAGDEVLAYVGDLLRHSIRTDDFALRYGGDEFVLILPGVSVDMAQATAERILATFAQRAKMMAAIQPVPTMSAGIAGILRNRPGQPNELLAMADAALLSSKQNGKHRVEIFTGTVERLPAAGKPLSTNPAGSALAKAHL